MSPRLFGASILSCAACVSALAQPVPVTLKQESGQWSLLRDGKPYFVRGGGGQGYLDDMVELGGNSIRTWGADNLQRTLDEAHKRGLTVTVGLWLGHERHGFDYTNADQVAKQYDDCKAAVLKYKDHPAVLAWGIGNEMEVPEGKNAAIWSAINNIASMVKKLDPNHPTMTVVAEIGGDKVKNIHRLCPDIDIVGINSYGGAASVPERYRELGGVKPYIVTEFGPLGQWELPKNAWGVNTEFTSTEKAKQYRDSYQGAVLGSKGLCLGSYAFIWGHKEEATATWFGMFLAQGPRLGAVDVISEFWTGKPVKNRCPVIEPITLEGAPERKPGEAITARVKFSDPENDTLTVKWELMGEPTVHAEGGDAIPKLARYPDAVKVVSDREVTVTLPAKGEKFRLYVFVTDTGGGAATANVPLRAKP